MFDYSSGSKLLTPDGHICADYSRFSSPRSSLGEGLSTDCEADVESNLSVVSGDLSGEGRNTLCRNSLTESDWSHSNTDSDKNPRKGIEWREISTERKIAFFIALTSLLLVLTGFILFSTLDFDCDGNCKTAPVPSFQIQSQWTTALNGSYPSVDSQFMDVNGDGTKDIVFIIWTCSNVSCPSNTQEQCHPSTDKNHQSAVSRLIVIDTKTGHLINVIHLSFYATWLQCINVSNQGKICLCTGRDGQVASINMTQNKIIFQKQTCTQVLSCRLMRLDQEHLMTISVCFCLWEEDHGSIYGLSMHYLGADGIYSRSAFFESDLFADNAIPTPSHMFVMRYGKQRNSSLMISFQTSSHSCSLWMIPSASIFNQLLSSNQLGILHLQKLMEHVDCALSPLQLDVNQDGVNDLVTLSVDKSLLIKDGLTNEIEQLVSKDDEEIVGIRTAANKKHPLLLLLRKGFKNDCPLYSLEILNPAGSMTSSKLPLPGLPLLTYANQSAEGLNVFMWLNTAKQTSCLTHENKNRRKRMPKHEDTKQRSDSLSKKTVQEGDKNMKDRKESIPISKSKYPYSETIVNDDSHDPSFETEERLEYWRELLKSGNPSLTAKLKGSALPETIQHLCVQIIRNLEELLERHFDKSMTNEELEDQQGERFNIFLKQIENGNEFFTGSKYGHDSTADDMRNLRNREQYGDIYYVVISMILREVGHLKSIALQSNGFIPEQDILIKRLREISDIDQLKSNQVSKIRKNSPSNRIRKEWHPITDFKITQKTNINKEKNSIPASPPLSRSFKEERDFRSVTEDQECDYKFRLLHLISVDGKTQVKDVTKDLLRSLPTDLKKSADCKGGNSFILKSMSADDKALYLTALSKSESCQLKMIKLPKATMP